MAPAPRSLKLLAQTQRSDQGAVALHILLLQVSQHRTALADHLEQAAAGMIVLLVHLEVLGQLMDARGQDRDLDFRGTGVGRVGAVCLDNGGLVFLTDHCVFHLSK